MKYNLYINADIGRYGISGEFVRQQLMPYANKPVSVYIRSRGGDVNEALDIYRQFVDHGDVTAYIFGFTASAATLIAMGAKKIVMSKNAMMLIHRCSGLHSFYGYLNRDQIEQKIKELKKSQSWQDDIDQIVASIYSARSQQKAEDIAKVMKQDKWLTCAKCKKLGIVDEVLEEKETKKLEMSDGERSIMMAYGLPDPASNYEDDDDSEEPDTEDDDEEVSDNGTAESPEASANGLVQTLRMFLKSLGFPIKDVAKDEAPKDEAPKEDPKEETPTVDNTNPQTNSVMAENHSETQTGSQAVLDAIGAEKLETAADGSVTLSAEQLAKLQGKLSENATLQQQVTNLGKADGAKTTHVEGSEEAEEMMLGAMARKMYDKYKDAIN